MKLFIIILFVLLFTRCDNTTEQNVDSSQLSPETYSEGLSDTLWETVSSSDMNVYKRFDNFELLGAWEGIYYDMVRTDSVACLIYQESETSYHFWVVDYGIFWNKGTPENGILDRINDSTFICEYDWESNKLEHPERIVLHSDGRLTLSQNDWLYFDGIKSKKDYESIRNNLMDTTFSFIYLRDDSVQISDFHAISDSDHLIQWDEAVMDFYSIKDFNIPMDNLKNKNSR